MSNHFGMRPAHHAFFQWIKCLLAGGVKGQSHEDVEGHETSEDGEGHETSEAHETGEGHEVEGENHSQNSSEES